MFVPNDGGRMPIKSDLHFNQDWSADLTHIPVEDRQAFLEKVDKIAIKLETDPDWLMAVMKYESEGINPAEVNENPNSGATGLIQFMPDTAKRLGTTVQDLKRMSGLQQLDYVEKYLLEYKGRMDTPTDTYMAVFSPAFIGKGEDYVAYDKNSSKKLDRDRYRWNSGLDLNKDGNIQNGELGSVVKKFLKE